MTDEQYERLTKSLQSELNAAIKGWIHRHVKELTSLSSDDRAHVIRSATGNTLDSLVKPSEVQA